MQERVEKEGEGYFTGQCRIWPLGRYRHWKLSPFNLFWLPTEGELLRSVTCLPHSLSSEAATQQLWALAMNELSHVLHSAALRLVFNSTNECVLTFGGNNR